MADERLDITIRASGGFLMPDLLTKPTTRTVVVRSRGLNRPWRWLQGKPTWWVVQWNEPPLLPVRNPLRDALPSFSTRRGV